MNETTNELVTRLIPKLRRIANRYASQADPEDLTQEALLAIMQAVEGQTDSWYVTQGVWAMTAALRSPRYRRQAAICDEVDRQATSPAAHHLSGAALLSELAPATRRVAVLRYHGASWVSCRKAVGKGAYRRARRELDAYLTP